MLFDNERECCGLAYRLLQSYEHVFGTGCSVEQIRFSENRMYLIRDAGGEEGAVLRLCRPGYHTEEELQAEVRWLLALAQSGAPTASESARQVPPQSSDSSVPFVTRGVMFSVPLMGADEKYVHSVYGRDGMLYHGVVFQYLTGVLLEELPPEQQAAWFGRIGEAAALLHRQVRGWSDAKKLPRFRWTYETMLGKNAVWGDWRKVPAFTPRMPAVLAEADRMIRSDLEAYGMQEERYGLIHGDLRAANLIADREVLKILDFDDCGYGWYMQDLAAALSFAETRDIVPQLISGWIRGYEKISGLNRADKEMIPTFIMMRRLQLTAWVAGRAVSGAEAAQTAPDDFAAGTVALAKRYVHWQKGKAVLHEKQILGIMDAKACAAGFRVTDT